MMKYQVILLICSLLISIIQVESSVYGAKTKRNLKSKKAKKVSQKTLPPILMTEFNVTGPTEIEGWAMVAHADDGMLDIDFDLQLSIGGCTECYISMQKSCEDDAKEHYRKTTIMYSPFNVTTTGFSTNTKGHAAAIIKGIDNGIGYKRNTCKALAVYGPVKVEVKPAITVKKPKKTKKPKKVRRGLKSKSKMEKGLMYGQEVEVEYVTEIKMVACAKLFNEGTSILFCDDSP